MSLGHFVSKSVVVLLSNYVIESIDIVYVYVFEYFFRYFVFVAQYLDFVILCCYNHP